MVLLRVMVARGQVELFGAGDTEPVLAAIPHGDRIGQVQGFSDKLETKLGQRPRGAWLTERVWDSTVVPALADCSIRYVIVDDYHFLCAGKQVDDLNSYYTTEEDGRTLDLFPISEALRYRIPFSPAEEVVAYMESLAGSGRATGGKAAIYFDDIEKFGIWPETYQWVYENGWLDKFIQGVLGSPIINAEHYGDYHSATKTRGIVYLPTTSYIEMNEWTLPAAPARAYSALVHHAKAEGWYEGNKAFLRGGIWRNFFSRYPESNWMHKRMLSLSRRLRSLPEDQRSAAMKQKLYESQANDAYWHGLFGGLYLPHLRRAVYKAIVELEAMLDAHASRSARFTEDTDLDGFEELYLQNGVIQAVLKLDGSGSACELDSYLLKHNFGDTLRRQAEHYYHKMHEGQNREHAVSGIASAHDRVSFKHKIDAEDITLDEHGRGLFMDRLNGTAVDYQHKPLPDHGRYCHAEVSSPQIEKSFELVDNVMWTSYRFAEGAEGTFTTEINLAMPSCDGWGGRYVYEGAILGGFGQPIELDRFSRIMLDDDELGGSIELKASHPALLRGRPYYSVSQSEAGFEKIMQAVTLVLEWQEMIFEELVITLEVKPKAKPGTLGLGNL
jgi:4-alpha-glucanotransferase/alpha-amylase